MRKAALTFFAGIILWGAVFNAPWMILFGVLGAAIVAPAIWFDA